MTDDTLALNYAKTAELFLMLFGLWAQLGPDPPCKGAIIRGKDMLDDNLL